jgi:2,3-diaminopropionate biosynthesis protein SbnA
MRRTLMSVIGNTPLVALERVFADAPFNLYAKLEGLNPGGSIKDRTAYNILSDAQTRGLIGPGTTVIESSSGNMGIGLAQMSALMGLKFICVVDPKTTAQNIDILRAYGAQIDMVMEPDPVTGEYLKARIDRVEELLHIYPDGFWPNQYSNLRNPDAHRQTMDEIVRDLEGEVDYLFCAVSTCGTMRGCAEYISAHGLHTKVIAVDAVGSVIFGRPRAKRLIPGHGAAVTPQLFRHGLAYDSIHVTDLDCVVGCRRLVQEEAILAGGSSGAVISAIEQMRDRIPAGSNCVAIFPDRGERYLDTIYSDVWVSKHFGEVFYQWQVPQEVELCVTAA